jgi:hypothetical protein
VLLVICKEIEAVWHILLRLQLMHELVEPKKLGSLACSLFLFTKKEMYYMNSHQFQ